MKQEKSKKNKKPSAKMMTKTQNKEQGELEEYLYLFPVDVSVRELENAISLPIEKKEIWTELDLMEIILPTDSLVLENFMDCFAGQEDQALLEHYQAQKVYAFNYNSVDRAQVAQVLKELHQAFGGIIASDTEDLQPVMDVESFGL